MGPPFPAAHPAGTALATARPEWCIAAGDLQNWLGEILCFATVVALLGQDQVGAFRRWLRGDGFRCQRISPSRSLRSSRRGHHYHQAKGRGRALTGPTPHTLLDSRGCSSYQRWCNSSHGSISAISCTALTPTIRVTFVIMTNNLVFA